MKGLLLKDWYMMKKYCRAYLLIAVFFLAVSLFSDANLFFVFYPCLLCGMIPVNLLAYDERSRWYLYCETMPYTRKQIVSGKYLIGLMAQGAMFLITGIVQAVRMRIGGTFHPSEYLAMMLLFLLLSLIASSICLPFMFKSGVEKGRMVYSVMIGVVCAMSVLSTNLFTKRIGEEMLAAALLPVLPIVCLIGVLLYALSWYLSIVFYAKREL